MINKRFKDGDSFCSTDVNMIIDAVNSKGEQLPGDGGSGVVSNKVIWHGKLREDEINNKIVSLVNGENRRIETWKIDVDTIPPISNGDTIKVYLELDPLSAMTGQGIDRIMLEYQVEICATMNSQDAIPSYEGENFVVLFARAVGKHTFVKFSVNQDAALENSNEYNYTLIKPEHMYTFGGFADLFIMHNFNRLQDISLAEGEISQENYDKGDVLYGWSKNKIVYWGGHDPMGLDFNNAGLSENVYWNYNSNNSGIISSAINEFSFKGVSSSLSYRDEMACVEKRSLSSGELNGGERLYNITKIEVV